MKKYSSKKGLASNMVDLRVRRTLKGHISKVYEFDFCQTRPEYIVSASQDGKLIIWNGISTHKLYVIDLKSQWVLSCAYSPSGRTVSCGGLDNTFYSYELGDDVLPEDHVAEFKGHEGCISKLKYLDEEHVITVSGDRTAYLWNLTTPEPETHFVGHRADVLCLDIARGDNNIFLTGSIDRTSLLWDIRSGKNELSFTGHGSDINTIKFFPNQTAFASGSDDGTVRLYDLRGDRELMVYTQPVDEAYRIFSLDFSKSGKYFFTACNDLVYMWDTLSGNILNTLEPGDIVSHVGVNPNGLGLFTATWNNFIKIYA